MSEQPTNIALSSLIEAIVFASTQPLPIAQIMAVAAEAQIECDKQAVENAIVELMNFWNDERTGGYRGLELVETAGGLIFRTKPVFGPFIRALHAKKPEELTSSQLEVLSVIAYRQPATRVQIEEIRGVDCTNQLRKLMLLQLVKIVGKSEGIGRPFLNGTTKRFLTFFGLNSLHELPPIRDFEDVAKKVAAPSEQQLGMLQDLFAQIPEGISDRDANKLSDEALKGLEAALGLVAEKTKEVDSSQLESNEATDGTTT